MALYAAIISQMKSMLLKALLSVCVCVCNGSLPWVRFIDSGYKSWTPISKHRVRQILSPALFFGAKLDHIWARDVKYQLMIATLRTGGIHGKAVWV